MAIQKGNVLIILYHFIFGKRADIIKGIKLEAPVEVGDVVVKNIMGYDSDLIVTKQVGVK